MLLPALSPVKMSTAGHISHTPQSGLCEFKGKKEKGNKNEKNANDRSQPLYQKTHGNPLI